MEIREYGKKYGYRVVNKDGCEGIDLMSNLAFRRKMVDRWLEDLEQGIAPPWWDSLPDRLKGLSRVDWIEVLRLYRPGGKTT